MIDPNELERLSKAATAPGALIADKGAFLVALETAYRTGQLVPAQPSDILSPDAIRDCLVTTVLATPAQPSDPWAGQAELLDECQKAASELDRQALANIRTLTDAQPSGDVVEAVARAIMVTNGACFVKDWTTERRDNPHVALAWDQATAAITAYEAASGVAKMREDAARYRWLRDVSCPPHNFYISVPDEFHGVKYGPDEVDAYIDAARAALKQEGPDQ